jgi:hypothetical protein
MADSLVHTLLKGDVSSWCRCQNLYVDRDDMAAAGEHGRPIIQALPALAAWLLTEDAYERGGIPDEVLSYMQDHIDDLLGQHATSTAADFLRRHVAIGGDLVKLAHDRSALIELLTLIEGHRRQDSELEWRAD